MKNHQPISGGWVFTEKLFHILLSLEFRHYNTNSKYQQLSILISTGDSNQHKQYIPALQIQTISKSSLL